MTLWLGVYWLNNFMELIDKRSKSQKNLSYNYNNMDLLLCSFFFFCLIRY